MSSWEKREIKEIDKKYLGFRFKEPVFKSWFYALGREREPLFNKDEEIKLKNTVGGITSSGGYIYYSVEDLKKWEVEFYGYTDRLMIEYSIFVTFGHSYELRWAFCRISDIGFEPYFDMKPKKWDYKGILKQQKIVEP